MLKVIQQQHTFKKAVLGVFLICLAYWIYLIFASQMQISWDAIDYEKLGLKLHEKGWRAYLVSGPQREPLYPFTISVSMALGEMLSISYQTVQKILQVAVLFITQILLLLTLNKLRINNAIKLAALIYFGFSPALVNSAFSLYSEIMALPFMLAAVLCGISSFKAIQTKSIGSVVIYGICTAVIFILAAFTKGIFQYVFIFFLTPYLYAAIYAARKKSKIVLLKSGIYIVLTLTVFNSAIIAYKLVNQRINNNFEFTNRYAQGLFGCVARRADKLTFKKLLINLASVPGGGACRLFFTDAECRTCEYHRADYHARQTLSRLLENTPQSEVKAKTLALTFKQARETPFQQILLIGFEALKMPFWESTQIGYVTYPAWLANLFNFRLFKDGLRLIVAILTYCSIISLAVGIFKKRNVLVASNSREDEIAIASLFILLIIASYASLYSIFLVITRYILPIAPLFIIIIAYFFDNKVNKGKSKL